MISEPHEVEIEKPQKTMHYFKLFSLSLTILSFSLLTTSQVQAQSGKKMPHWEVRAGVGLLPTFLKDHAKTELQPLSLEVRYRPTKKFSLGLLAGSSISQAMQEHHTGETRLVRNNFQMIALRGAVHSNPFEKWELYGGMTLGYTNSNVDYTNLDDPKDSEPSFFPQPKERDGLLFSAFLGTSYKVYNNVNLFGELSYGLSLATAGVAVRF